MNGRDLVVLGVIYLVFCLVASICIRSISGEDSKNKDKKE